MVCSKFWRLDKIDKIVISLILIVVSMFSIFSCFCFASEIIEPIETGTGLFLRDGVIVSNNNGKYAVYYFDKAGTYEISSSLDVVIGSSVENSFSAGTSLENYTFLNANNTINYTVDNDNSFVYLFASSYYVNFLENISITYSPFMNGFETAISSLISNVGLSQLWSTFEVSLPWVLVVVLFVFGWWFFSHWVKELSKGREF